MTDRRGHSQANKGKTLLVVLSVVIALLLWAYVVTQVNPTVRTTVPNIPVQLLNKESLAARGLAVAGSTDYSVNVAVEGKRSDISKLEADEVVAEADLFGWSKGANDIPVTIRLPDAVRQVDIKAYRIKVTIEELVEQSRPVKVVLKGDLPENTEPGRVDIQPGEVNVRGAKSEVESVKELQAILDVARLGEDGGTLRIDLLPVSRAGTKVENVRLSASVAAIDYQLLHLKEVPLKIETTGAPSGNLKIEISVPKTIWVKGSREAVREVSEARAKPISLAKYPEGGTFDLDLQLPADILPADANKTVRATIRVIETATRRLQIPTDRIEWRGLAADKIVSVAPGNIDVAVSGAKKVVDSLTVDQIRLYTDAAKWTDGVQTASIQAETKAEAVSLEITPTSVEATVTSAAAPAEQT